MKRKRPRDATLEIVVRRYVLQRDLSALLEKYPEHPGDAAAGMTEGEVKLCEELRCELNDVETALKDKLGSQDLNNNSDVMMPRSKRRRRVPHDPQLLVHVRSYSAAMEGRERAMEAALALIRQGNHKGALTVFRAMSSGTTMTLRDESADGERDALKHAFDELSQLERDNDDDIDDSDDEGVTMHM